MLESPSPSRLRSAMVRVISSEALWPTHRAREGLVLFLPLKTKGNSKYLLRTRWEGHKDCSKIALGDILPLMASMGVSWSLRLDIVIHRIFS